MELGRGEWHRGAGEGVPCAGSRPGWGQQLAREPLPEGGELGRDQRGVIAVQQGWGEWGGGGVNGTGEQERDTLGC